MHVYAVTDVDRDLLLAGADLEAVLADRERERLERDERTEARPAVGGMARLGHQAPGSAENSHVPPKPVSV